MFRILMKRFTSLILLSLLLASCNKDEEPVTEEFSAYCSLYHFVDIPENLVWEIDGVAVDWEQDYGSVISGFVLLEEEREEISFIMKNAITGNVIDSLSFSLTDQSSYLLSILGSEDEPISLFEEVSPGLPSSGNLNIRFLHAAPELHSLDIYLGGGDPENKIINRLAYAGLTGYQEVDERSAQISITVTSPEGSSEPDSAYLYYAFNDALVRGRNYLTVIAPASSDSLAELLLWLYTQPTDFW